jgi:hypothetical protein
VSNDPSPALVALALFAEAVADRDRRRSFANDTLGLLEAALADKNRTLTDLDPDVRQAYVDLFGDLSFEELRLLARLQAKMVELDPDQVLGLTEKVEVGSHATLAKL